MTVDAPGTTRPTTILDASATCSRRSPTAPTPTATATPTTSPAGTSSTTTTTRSTPRATRRRVQPRHRPRPGGRASSTNDGAGGTGLCPRCQIVPLRVWDTFVADTNNFALASLYAADNGIEVVEAALGGLSNSRFAREAMRARLPPRRLLRGRLVATSTPPTTTSRPLYDEAMMVQGTVADHAGPRLERSAEVGGVPRRPRDRHATRPSAPGSATPARPSTAATRTSSMPAVTGSAGDRPGGGRGRADRVLRAASAAATSRRTRSSSSSRMTAEDVVAENTVGHRRARPRAARLGPALRLRPRPTSGSRSSGSGRARSRRRR